MALNLHEGCIRRLKEVLAEALAEIRVEHQTYIDFPTTTRLFDAGNVLPQKGKQAAQIQEFVSETPIHDFVFSILARELSETHDYKSDAPASALREFPEYRDIGALASRLATDFDSLPWDYTITTPLQNDFAKLLANTGHSYKLSDEVFTVAPTKELVERFPLASGNEKRDRWLRGGTLFASLLRIPTAEKYNENAAHIQIRVRGFIDKYASTQPFERARSTLKAFFGLALAVRLLRVERKYSPMGENKILSYIHRRIENSWVIEGVRELERAAAEVASELVVDDLDGTVKSDKDKTDWIVDRLSLISFALSNPGTQRIQLAAQWLFESFCGRNELLSFVQCAVVLEILLGDEAMTDVLGLSQLLRNRCAYLIGRSAKQRDEILADFTKIYEVRSKIVHAGKSRLNLNERTLFNSLRWMCQRVIQQELELLKKDKSSN